jgi:hypothetical protein
MKKFISLLSLALLLYSCEKAPINLTDENIELRLESIVGENINSVSNTLKSEGFKKLDFDTQINYNKGKETYILKENNKIVTSAGYQFSDSTKINSFFFKYHDSFQKKNTNDYYAEIYAINFSDWSKSYVDSINLENNNYIYIYDDPYMFSSAIQINMPNMVYCYESWKNENSENKETWSIQLGERAKTICITYSNLSIK